MGCSLEIDALLSTTAALITAIPIGDFGQAGYNEDGWHKSRGAGAPVVDGGALSHLTFAVVAGRSLNIDGAEDYAAEIAQVRTPLQVSLTYHIRTGGDTQVTDEALAQQAAKKVVQAVMRDKSTDRTVNLVSPWFGLVSDDGEWMLVTAEFDVVHDFPL